MGNCVRQENIIVNSITSLCEVESPQKKCKQSSCNPFRAGRLAIPTHMSTTSQSIQRAPIAGHIERSSWRQSVRSVYCQPKQNQSFPIRSSAHAIVTMQQPHERIRSPPNERWVIQLCTLLARRRPGAIVRKRARAQVIGDR